MQRGRQRLSRENAALRRSDGLTRSGTLAGPSGRSNGPRSADGPPEGPLSPEDWRNTVWLLDEGRCVNCRISVPRNGSMFVWNAHHPVLKQNLPPERRWDPRNGVTLCRSCHDGHHGIHPVPRAKLPARVWSFCREVGEWATVAVERAHP